MKSRRRRSNKESQETKRYSVVELLQKGKGIQQDAPKFIQLEDGTVAAKIIQGHDLPYPQRITACGEESTIETIAPLTSLEF